MPRNCDSFIVVGGPRPGTVIELENVFFLLLSTAIFFRETIVLYVHSESINL